MAADFIWFKFSRLNKSGSGLLCFGFEPEKLKQTVYREILEGKLRPD